MTDFAENKGLIVDQLEYRRQRIDTVLMSLFEVDEAIMLGIHPTDKTIPYALTASRDQ